MTKKNNKSIIILVIVIILLVIGIVLTNNQKKVLSPEEAKTAASDFINKVLMKGSQQTASVEEVKEFKGGLYSLKIKIGDQTDTIDSYISKDGKLFFPQSLDIDKMSGKKTSDSTDKKDQPVAQAPKADKPVVELFVMSYCPYGTQIEKGILPVVEALGDKIDFQLKFVNYAMHDKKELDENLRQYCIRTEQHSKLYSYLDCFLKAGDSPSCLKETKIDQKKLNACVAKTDKKYKVSEVYKSHKGWDTFPPFKIDDADNQKYGVQGSPTLIINGKEIRASRDSASLAEVICNSFNKKPKACDQKFSDASPSPGFGTGTTNSGGADANCGN